MCQQPSLQAEIRTTYISEYKLSVIFIAKDICPCPVFLHHRTNNVRCHTVGSSIHSGTYLTIILTQCSGQGCSPLITQGFEKLLVIVKHRFRFGICEQ